MKAFAQFFYSDGRRLLGTDGVFPLDGRWNYHTACKQAETQQWRLRLVQPNIAGFDIMRGDFRHAVKVGPSHWRANPSGLL